jgi:uncharacterized membrane protein
MSLKGFHIVFVTITTLLCIFLTVWSFVLAPEASTLATVLGVIGVVGALGMPVYGVYFYRKATRILI